MKIVFTPDIRPIEESLAPTVTVEVVSEEPLLFSASPEFAQSFGGPLTRAALHCMRHYLCQKPPDGFHWVIDTRSHMLMPGQYPAIGGWHCDAVPRAHYEAQPDVERMRADIWHLAAHVSTSGQVGGISSTEFIVQPLELEVDPKEVWASTHTEVVKLPEVKTWTPGDGKVVIFNTPTLHRAAKTRQRGWRWWIRASMYYSRPINKIRRQVQVYTSSEGAGW